MVEEGGALRAISHARNGAEKRLALRTLDSTCCRQSISGSNSRRQKKNRPCPNSNKTVFGQYEKRVIPKITKFTNSIKTIFSKFPNSDKTVFGTVMQTVFEKKITLSPTVIKQYSNRNKTVFEQVENIKNIVWILFKYWKILFQNFANFQLLFEYCSNAVSLFFEKCLIFNYYFEYCFEYCSNTEKILFQIFANFQLLFEYCSNAVLLFFENV